MSRRLIEMTFGNCERDFGVLNCGDRRLSGGSWWAFAVSGWGRVCGRMGRRSSAKRGRGVGAVERDDGAMDCWERRWAVSVEGGA